MEATPDYITTFTLPSRSFRKVMEPEEFIEFVRTKRHLLKKSKFIPPRIGSSGFGKFLVEIEDGKRHLTTRRIGEF